MYMYDWVPSPFTLNYHNIVTCLYPNTKKKFKKHFIFIFFFKNILKS